MDGNFSKSFEDAISDLEKAMPKAPAPAPTPAPAPAPAPAPMPAAHEEPDGDEDGEDEDEDGDGVPAPAPMKKSGDEDTEFLDVSPILASFTKSLKAVEAEIQAVRAENAELRKSLEAQDSFLKSLGNVQLMSAQVLKSLSETPTMRKSVLNRQERFGGADPKKAGEGEMSPDDILRKSTEALRQGKISFRDASIVEDRINKGMEVPEGTLAILKSL